MKKLIIASAIVFAAVFAEAANCNWMLAGFYKPVATKEGPLTASSGTLFPAGSTDITMKLFIVYTEEAAEKTLQVTSVDPITFSGNGMKSSAKLWDADTTLQNLATYGDGNNLTLRLVANYSDANYDYVYTSDVVKDVHNINNQAVTYTFMGSTANAWTATAIPEPTSGLLLLLGVAGLALKRRRA